MARTPEEAQEAFAPFLTRFHNTVLAAIQKYKELPLDTAAMFKARTVASIISDLWNHGVLTELNEDNRVKLDTRYARLRFFIDGFQVRLKKVNHALLSRNIATQEELRFVNQQQPEQLLLFDLPQGITNLTVGYLWDMLTDTVRVFVICPQGARIEWFFEVPEATDDGVKKAVVRGPIDPRPEREGRRVIVRSDVARKVSMKRTDG